jgi:hypothetical protein
MSYIPSSWQEAGAEEGEKAAHKFLSQQPLIFEDDELRFDEEILEQAKEIYAEAATNKINRLDKNDDYGSHDVDYAVANSLYDFSSIALAAVPLAAKKLLPSLLKIVPPDRAALALFAMQANIIAEKAEYESQLAAYTAEQTQLKIIGERLASEVVSVIGISQRTQIALNLAKIQATKFSPTTTVLLVGQDRDSHSEKIADAQQKGIKILHEVDFLAPLSTGKTLSMPWLESAA